MPHRLKNTLPINTHHDHKDESTNFGSKAPIRSLHRLQPRDSITIYISNTFASNNTVSNSQNGARFQVINNAKNSAIAMGDNSTHNVTFDSFGDKNMVNSTGSATGGWNTKNHGTNISTEPHKRAVECNAGCNKTIFANLIEEDDANLMVQVRDLVNVNVLNGKVKDSNLTRSGNGNTVELHIAGKGDNVVNVTIEWEAEDSNVEDSLSNNTVKIYVGDMEDDLGNNTVIII